MTMILKVIIIPLILRHKYQKLTRMLKARKVTILKKKLVLTMRLKLMMILKKNKLLIGVQKMTISLKATKKLKMKQRIVEILSLQLLKAKWMEIGQELNQVVLEVWCLVVDMLWQFTHVVIVREM